MVTRTPNDEDRIDAVRIAEQFGFEEAARQTGWSSKSISKWSRKGIYKNLSKAAPGFNEEEWKEQVIRTLKAVSFLAAERELSLAPQAEMSLANKVRTTAVHDIQLLEGKATERTESVDATDAEIMALADELTAQHARELIHES